MVWPFTKRKTAQEQQIADLEADRALKEAKLRNAEIDDDVIRAARINAVFRKLTEGANGSEDIEQRVRVFAQQAGIGYEELRREFKFKDAIKRLDSMDDRTLKKMETLMGLDKEHRKMIGLG